MDRGGKSEFVALKELTRELYHYLNVTARSVKTMRHKVCKAKELFNNLPAKVAYENDLANSSVENLNPSQNRYNANEKNSSDEELGLEGEIIRILQVAEKIRDTAYPKHNKKTCVNTFSTDERKKNHQKKEQLVTSSKTIQVFSSCPKRKTGSSHLKTTYRQDFSLKKGKSMPSLNKISTTSEKDLANDKCNKKSSLLAKNQMSSKIASTRLSENLSSSAVRRATDNNQTRSRFHSKKTFMKNEYCCSTTHEPPQLFQRTNLKEPFLSEEILLRCQNPGCRNILSVLRDYHSFMIESRRKFEKEEITLKENFLRKCNISEKIKHERENDLQSIFESLIPHCSWVLREDQSLTCLNLNCVKEEVIKSEDKLKHIKYRNLESEMEFNPHDTLIFPELEWSSRNIENWNLNEFSIWNLAIIPLICKEIKGIPYVYYKDVHEWISFSNSIHKLQEFHLQIKIIEHIHPIILQYFHLQEGNQNKVDRIISKNQKASLALLLKTMVTISDFSGHLTVPVLASLTSDCVKPNTKE